MAQLKELKKRLRGVEQVRQLAGAMKTVASAKYARLARLGMDARRYAAEAQSLPRLLPPGQAESGKAERPLCLALGHNRGLCGGYHSALLAFAREALPGLGDCRLWMTGRATIARFAERGLCPERQFLLPDVPAFADCRELLAALPREGEVWLLRQRFVNTLTQTPVLERLLPLPAAEGQEEAPLCLPGESAVAERLRQMALESALYQAILEAAQGAQAATLSAMRTAYDNAGDSARALELEIQKMRQSAVTAGVLETASGAARE